MRKIINVFLVIALINILACWQGHSESSYDEAGRKAKEIHDIAATDVIYTDQELKALYYQNVQIIRILEEIKELLRRQVRSVEERQTGGTDI